MAANFIANAYYIIDMIFVGRLGPTSLAAVSLGGVLMSFTWTILLGIAISTSSLVARYYGAQNTYMLGRVTMQSLAITFVFAFFLVLFGLFGVQHALRLMGAEDRVLVLGISYARIVFIGAGSLIVLFVVNSIFRGSGDVKTPMISLMVSSAINIILDPLLIFGIGPFPRLEVQGAAIATVAGLSAGALLNLFVLYKGYSRVRITTWSIKPDAALLRTQISIAVPGSLQNFFMSVSGFIIMRLVAAYGTFAVAAYGIGLRLDLMVMLPGWALGAAVATILGQNLGARQPERAEKTAWQGVKLYLVLLCGFSAILWLGAETIIGFFNNDPEVLGFGVDYIHTVVFGYLFLALSLILTMAMNGAGYTLIPMVVIFISVLGFRVPAAVVFSKFLHFGTRGLWTAVAASFILQAILSALVFAQGKWKRRKVA